MGKIVLTFDQDWVPDPYSDSIINTLRERNIKSTWFITHRSKILDKLRKYDNLFELGIHPNFLPGTTHGSTENEILLNMMNLVPEAKLIRTHSVYQSGPLISKITEFSNIKYDSSIFLPNMPGIVPILHHTPHRVLKRFPIFWADDHELVKKKKSWDLPQTLKSDGLKIFLFHPIHIVYNSDSLDHYRKCKDNDGVISYKEEGVRSFFTKLVDFITSSKHETSFIDQL